MNKTAIAEDVKDVNSAVEEGQNLDFVSAPVSVLEFLVRASNRGGEECLRKAAEILIECEGVPESVFELLFRLLYLWDFDGSWLYSFVKDYEFNSAEALRVLARDGAYPTRIQNEARKKLGKLLWPNGRIA